MGDAEILGSVQKMFKYGRVFGHNPWQINESYEMKLELLPSLYSAFVVCLLAFNFAYLSIWLFIVKSEEGTLNSLETMYYYYKIMEGFTSLLSFTYYIRGYHRMVVRLRLFFKCTQLIKKYQIPLEVDSDEQHYILLIFVGILYVTILIADFFICIYWNNVDLTVTSWLLGIFTILFNRFSLVQFIVIFDFNGKLFSAFNREIRNINTRKHNINDEGETIFFTAKERVRTVFYLYDTFVYMVEQGIIDSNILILSQILSSIIGLTGFLYSNFVLIINYVFKNEEFQWLIFVQSLYWSVFIFATIAIMIFTSSHSVEVCNDMAMAIHEVLCEEDSFLIADELENFSLQLLHKKIDVSVFGLFQIDSHLLGSMIVATITFLVILIQS
ncbi:uncharacterized protein LOC120352424 [Nilaparvata lugens]|uniref:uncharacterized protein LOC120352424 n=1 Tax=Nilaparvata lugens TaxID=108931 RepID=UPI00193CAB5E|nr:uncharacterized protein LOC120352424 [Nilaparvata lugens]